MNYTKDEILEKVKGIISDRFGIDDIAESSHVINDLGLDSLDQIELLMDLECYYEISISDDEMDSVRTIEEIVNALYNKANQ